MCSFTENCQCYPLCFLLLNSHQTVTTSASPLHFTHHSTLYKTLLLFRALLQGPSRSNVGEEATARGFTGKEIVEPMGNSCITASSSALLRETNDRAFEWKIYGFSALLDRGGLRANSAAFHCCGYTWFLQMTPMHKKLGAETPHVALCLALSRTSFKPGYVMNAMFELSMYNHSNGTYHGQISSYCFEVTKTHSEKKCLIPLEELMKSSQFLVDDSCVFGVKILKADVYSPKEKSVVVKNKSIIVQNLFLQKKGFIKGTYTWTIENFLDLELKPSVLSPAFEVGGHKWHISMYPRDQYITNCMSLFLRQDGSDELSPESGVMIELTLTILNQTQGEHYKVSGRFPSAVNNGWGWPRFIALKTLKDPSKGYLVGSSCIVKADIMIIGSSNAG